jgi:REP element-mobilizing transposase RayT
MYSDPQAYFLTWSCYGTRLHGDVRGTVDDEHRTFGTPFAPPKPRREAFERELLKCAPVVLSDAMREVVDDTVRAHCVFRRWPLLAINVRTTHVHVVVGAMHRDPGAMAGQFKAWSTRRLREAGLRREDEPVWSKRDSTRYLWTDEHVAEAVDYVLNGQ